MKKICVIGSFNIDIIATVEHFPKISETVRCGSFDLFIGGGKGANQAVALGKLGADVRMVGRLGEYFYGPEYLKVLEIANVKFDTVDVVKNAYPGAAFVSVDKNGDNILFVNPGTNAMVDVEFIKRHWDTIAECDIFLFQLEIPLETNLYAIRKLKELGKVIILDPAPAMPLPEEIFKYIDYITPNEVELEQLTGLKLESDEDFFKGARILQEKGGGTVIAKAGKRGAYIINAEGTSFVPAFKVKAVDPTAAGDSFNAGFAYSLSRGGDILENVRFANAVAGISTTAIGAQNAMPTIEEVEEFLKNKEIKE